MNTASVIQVIINLFFVSLKKNQFIKKFSKMWWISLRDRETKPQVSSFISCSVTLLCYVSIWYPDVRNGNVTQCPHLILWGKTMQHITFASSDDDKRVCVCVCVCDLFSRGLMCRVWRRLGAAWSRVLLFLQQPVDLGAEPSSMWLSRRSSGPHRQQSGAGTARSDVITSSHCLEKIFSAEQVDRSHNKLFFCQILVVICILRKWLKTWISFCLMEQHV